MNAETPLKQSISIKDKKVFISLYKIRMKTSKIQFLLVLLWLIGLPVDSFAQSEINIDLWYTQPGIIGTIVLCIIVLLVFSLIMILRISKL